jgi:hypothetical protein
VAQVQHVPGAVVDVDQQRVVPAVRVRRVQGLSRADGGEEVGRDQPRARVRRQLRRHREQARVVPADHLGQRLDHGQLRDPRVLQGGDRGVPQAQPADQHVEPVPVDGREAEPGQLDLGDREQAGHQELVAELGLEHVDVQGGLAAPPQADLAHRRLAPVELLEPCAHVSGSPNG